MVLRPDVLATEQDLLDHALRRLASYKKPTRMIVVDQLPRTATGKVQRLRLRELAVSADHTTEEQR